MTGQTQKQNMLTQWEPLRSPSQHYLAEYTMRKGKVWLEGGLMEILDKNISEHQSKNLPLKVGWLTKVMQLAAPDGPPPYQYTRAVSRYTAKFQVQARSLGLPTASRTAQKRKRNDAQIARMKRMREAENECPRCRRTLEDENHTFHECIEAQDRIKSFKKKVQNETAKYFESNSGGSIDKAAAQVLIEFSAKLIGEYRWWCGAPYALRPEELGELTRSQQTIVEIIWHRELTVGGGRLWSERMAAWYQKRRADEWWERHAGDQEGKEGGWFMEGIEL